MFISTLTPAAASVSLQLATGKFNFDTTLTLPTATVELADVVPLARRLCEQVSSSARTQASREGTPVCCSKRCAACCYALVPVPPVEASRLRRELACLPPGLQQRLRSKLIQSAQALVSHRAPQGADAQSVAQWYSRLQLPCPLLQDNQCSLYQTRPLACREQLAVGPAIAAGSPACPGQRPAQLPVSVLESLAELESCLTGQPLRSLPLPLALLQDEAPAQRFDSAHVLSAFAQILRARAMKLEAA